MARPALIFGLLLSGCDASTAADGIEPDPAPTSSTPFDDDIYGFESLFEPGIDSVAYSGQVSRHALIASLKGFIGGRIDGSYPAGTTTATIVADLRYFYDYKNEGGTGDDALAYQFDGSAIVQTTFGDLGAPASLFEKMPDQDGSWNNGIIGYDDDSLKPSEVVDAMFDSLAANIAARADGNIATAPNGTAIQSTFLTADGVDYQQLIQKYLDGAVTYSQACDDYLDDDIEGKGLLSDNVDAVVKDGVAKPFTELEHAWDEAFGYYGASRHAYLLQDQEIKVGANDANGDDVIDVLREVSQGHSLNASKRDLGASENAPTDFSHTALRAFLDGRALITATAGPIDVPTLQRLRDLRDVATGAWEKAIAATAVHYINEVVVDINNFDNDDYTFESYAKHWSELKGFSLALQFNPRMSLTPVAFASLQEMIGRAPVLDTASVEDIDLARTRLLAARDLLGTAHDFDATNLGDDEGKNGW